MSCDTPKINRFFVLYFFFLQTTTPCAGNLMFFQIFRIRSVWTDLRRVAEHRYGLHGLSV